MATEQGQSESRGLRSNKWKIGLAIGAILGAPLAVVAVPAAVGALGFGAGGIAAGSTAAWMMSVLGGGATAAGGLVATLQSVGAAGLGLSGILASLGAGAGLGAGVGAAAAKLYERMAGGETIPIPELVNEARQSFNDGNYNDARNLMVAVVNQKTEDLSQEEQILLSDSYEKLVEGLKNVLTKLKTTLQNEASPNSIAEIDGVEKILIEVCEEIIKLIDNKLLSHASLCHQSTVLYHKMKGDYHHHLAEVKQLTDSEKQVIKQAYDTAYSEADNLDTGDHLRLKVALNTAVFYHDVLREKHRALAIVQKAVQDNGRGNDNNGEILHQLFTYRDQWNNPP